MALLSRFVSALMVRDLRRAFRRVCWVGPPPALPPGVPVVLYANHHAFFDGYLMWLLAHRLLKRAPLTWMEQWDRFPFFAAVGALPFPPDEPARRTATLRKTIAQFRARPDSVLVYFPEGRLHAPDEGLLPFPPERFARLDRLFPEKCWWPVALHVTWWGEPTPTALLTGGAPHARAHGREHEALAEALARLRTVSPHPTPRVLLEGQTGRHENWDFSFARSFFS